MTYLPQIRILVPSAQVSSYTTGSFNLPSARGAFDPQNASRGIFAGGVGSGDVKQNVIDYINIKTLGNATDFGDLSTGTNRSTGGGSSTRAVICLGVTGSNDSSNVMEYITIATTGNATDFGDRTTGHDSGASLSNSTRMVMVSTTSRTDDYITIATTGNATDFGANWSSVSGDENACTVASSTRGLFCGGYDNNNGAPRKLIQYITIATTGTITTFGNLIKNGYSGKGGVSNGVRGVFKNDYGDNDMEYVTIASTGDGTFFGDLSLAGPYVLNAGDCSNGTRGIFAGGHTANNVISYIVVNTTGNNLDFGDLTVGRGGVGSTSDGHGGL